MMKRRKQTSKPKKQKCAICVFRVFPREHGDIFTENQTAPTGLARGVSPHIL